MTSQHRVLVVDDERGIQVVLREVLDLEGYEVRVAADGQEALDILSEWTPDVILLDLMMPRMDGPAFRNEMLKLPPGLRSIPVVVISGARDAGERSVALDSAAFLPKPFDLDNVVSTVDRVIGDYSPQ